MIKIAIAKYVCLLLVAMSTSMTPIPPIWTLYLKENIETAINSSQQTNILIDKTRRKGATTCYNSGVGSRIWQHLTSWQLPSLERRGFR